MYAIRSYYDYASARAELEAAQLHLAYATVQAPFAGLVLAGGMGRRVGGRDKGLLNYGGSTLVDHVIDRLSPQVARLVISANRNLNRYASFGHPVVSDDLPA